MNFKSLKTTAIAILLGFSYLFAVAQDDMPAKGQIESIIISPSKQLYGVKTVYEAQGIALKEYRLDGWKFNKKANFLAVENYSSNANYNAISPEITIPILQDGEQLFLSITEDFSLESNYDFGKVKISVDGGNSWRTVHGVTGQSDLRTAQINVSSIAGKTIQIALEMTSDASFESDGWNVYGITLLIGSTFVDPTSSSRTFKLKSVPQKEIQITSINYENFPEGVFVNFEYKVDGVFDFSLLIDDLEALTLYDGATEGGKCTPRLYTPDDSLIKKTIDILFIMDNSGSMGNKQDDVEQNIADFVSNINNPYVNFGLLRFGYNWSNYPSNQILETTQYNGQQVHFTPDANDFTTNVLSTNTSNSGGYEFGYEALNYGLSANFNTGSQKIFVLITDENTTDPYNVGDITDVQVLINSLKVAGVTVYSWIPSHASYDDTYALVAEETGGERYNILSDFSGLASDIANAVNGTYTYRYCPAEAQIDGIEHEISLMLLTDNSVVDAGSYTPTGFTEYIVRDAATVSLSGRKINDEGFPVDLGFIVTDNDGTTPTSGILLVRQMNASEFDTLTLVPDLSTPEYQRQWDVTVPGSYVQDPGFEYYAVMLYPDHELKSPSVQERFFAWTQAVDPNEPPVISILTSTGVQCSDAIIGFTVTDNTQGFVEAVLYYREKNSPANYNAITVYSGIEITTGTYSEQIPMIGDGIQYYIVAYDNHGVMGMSGDLTAPNEILPASQQVISTTSQMILNFDNITIACEGLQIGDILEARYVNDCGTYSPAGRKVITNLYDTYLIVYGDDDLSDSVKTGYEPGDLLSVFLIRNGIEFQIFYPVPYAENTQYNYAAANLYPVVNLELYDEAGNADLIINGDSIPTVAKSTDFGISTVPKTLTYQFANTGCGVVKYLNAQSSNNEFTATVTSNGKLSVTYKGTRNATSIITVYTQPTGTYTFKVNGIRTTCVEELMYGQELIQNDGSPASALKGTDFGLQAVAVTHTFDFSSSCSSTITVASTQTTGFSVSYTSTSVSVTYDALTDAAGTVSIETSLGTIYTINVAGLADPCHWGFEYNSVQIINGDNSPSTTDGTDFGTVSAATTHVFDFFQSGCLPAVSISSASSSNTEFTTSVSGTSVSVTYSAASDATGTITVVTSNGNFIFDVEGETSSGGSLSIVVSPNPMPSWGGNVTFDLPVQQKVTLAVYNSGGTLVQTVINNEMRYPYGDYTYTEWVSPSFGAGTYTLQLTTEYSGTGSVQFQKN